MTAYVGTPEEELKGIDCTKLSTRTLETFSRFASIIAGERIRIITGKFPTAAFDLQNRVIFLPEMTGITMPVYEMFIAHEVGHGIYTPGGEHGAKEWKDRGTEICPEHPELGCMYINVTEDARQEKLMCRKFPGAKKILLRGYTEIFEKDILNFISGYEKSKSEGKLLLIDRINCRAKFGQFFPVEFTDEEKPFMDRAYATETFEDAVQLAKDIFEFSKKNEQQKMQDQMNQLAQSKEEAEKMRQALEQAIKEGKLKIKGGSGGPGGSGSIEVEISGELYDSLSDEAKEALEKILKEHYENMAPVTEKHMNEKVEKHIDPSASQKNLDSAKKEANSNNMSTGRASSTEQLMYYTEDKKVLRARMTQRSTYSSYSGFKH